MDSFGGILDHNPDPGFLDMGHDLNPGTFFKKIYLLLLESFTSHYIAHLWYNLMCWYLYFICLIFTLLLESI